MSDKTASLSDLGQFEARSPLARPDTRRGNDALWALVRALEPARPVHRRMGDMVAAVRSYSARTSRMSQPHVQVEIDVFAPGGQRALRLFLPERD